MSDDANSSTVDVRLTSNTEERNACQQLRLDVFVKEQGIPYEVEIDGKDEDQDSTLHVVAIHRSDESIVGTGRLVLVLPEKNERTKTTLNGVIGRIAVRSSYRKQGIGKRIVQALEVVAREHKVQRLSLTPHAHLESFYKSLGFETSCGSNTSSLQAGTHRLISMEKTLV